MTTKKRQRELARAKEERRLARRAAEATRKRRRQRIVIYTLVAVLVLGLTGAGLLIALSNDAEESDPIADGSGNAQPVSICAPPGDLEVTDVQYEAPEQVIAEGEQIAFTMNTNCGPISFEADSEAAPQTVNSMAFLGENGFFSRTPCHRLTTEGIFVLQCGDPTGTGGGGPGYQIPDENLPAEGENNYPAGTVAMANSGPDTNGSQFFLVYQDTTLPPSYTIWGTITQGLDLIEAIAAAGTVDGGTDGAPRQTVVIDTMDVLRN